MSILGSKLKKVREEKGIPLEFIYNKSRVPVSTLEKIEKNEFHLLPQAYLNSFIRSYGKEIGLKEDFLKNCLQAMDNDPVIETLFNQLTAKTISTVHREDQTNFGSGNQETEQAETPSVIQDERQNELPTSGEKITASFFSTFFHSYKWIVAGTAGLVVLVFGIWQLINDGRVAEPTNAQPLSFDQVVSLIEKDTVAALSKPAVPTRQDTVVKPASISVAEARPDSSGYEYGLSITALKDSVWIGLQPLNKPKVEFTLAPGKSVLRKATRFTVTIGKVEAVRVLVNQKPFRFPKNEGSVLNYVIDQEQLRKASRGLQ